MFSNFGTIFFLFYADILYLNNQRLGAIEELNKTNKEKQFLFDKIRKLEAEKEGTGKTDCLHLRKLRSLYNCAYISNNKASLL